MLERWSMLDIEMSQEMYRYYESKLSLARSKERIDGLLDSASRNAYIRPLQLSGLKDLARTKRRELA